MPLARSAASNGVARDARRQRPIYSTLWKLRAVRCACGGYRPSRLPDNWFRAAGTGASQFRAPDRAALRDLPHRFSGADPLRTKVQTARLYDGEWSLQDDAFLIARRRRRAR